MTDITTLSATLGSIKTALDIAKIIKESGSSLEAAELKYKMAEMISALADAKIELAQVQETLAAKDKRIAELEDAFESKDELVRHLDAYYYKSEEGKPSGPAHCARCWDIDHKKSILVYDPKSHRSRLCPACKQIFDAGSASAIY